MSLQSPSEWMNRLKSVESPDASYWLAEPPLVFSRAHGSYVYDTNGKPYIDLCAGFGALALGHNSPEFLKVCQDQIEQSPIDHAMGDVYPSDSKIELLSYLIDLLPDHIEKGALALSGAGANEIALKTCLLHKPRGKILVFEGSYHGLDLGVLPLVSRRDFKDPFRMWLPEDRVVELCHLADFKTIEEVFAKHEIAGVFIEPIQGRAGIRMSDLPWLQGLRELCTQNGALLVFDEVFTGLGRIGTISSSFTISADLICLGKSLGGGMPLSACCGSQQAFSLWPENKGESIHTGTFFGHPFSCRTGLAFLKALNTRNLSQHAKELGDYAEIQLQSKIGKHPAVKSIAAHGLMIGITFQEEGAGAMLMNLLREQGVIALASGKTGESLTLTPPLNIPQSVFTEGLEILASVLLKYC